MLERSRPSWLLVAGLIFFIVWLALAGSSSDDPTKVESVEVPGKDGTTYLCLVADSGIWCEHDYSTWDYPEEGYTPGTDVDPPPPQDGA